MGERLGEEMVWDGIGGKVLGSLGNFKYTACLCICIIERLADGIVSKYIPEIISRSRFYSASETTRYWSV